jgi:hypothetical protein
MRIFVQEILERDEVFLYVGSSLRELVPRLAFVVSDHIEAQKLCLIKNSTRTRKPCRFCLVEPAKSGMGMGALGRRRSKQKMIDVVKSRDSARMKRYSIHPEENHLWLLPGYDVFRTPICRMHTTDHGLAPLIRNNCVSLLKKLRGLEDFDQRWKSIGEYPGMKVFHKGDTLTTRALFCAF